MRWREEELASTPMEKEEGGREEGREDEREE